MSIPKVSGNSRVTEVDALLKQSIAVYEKSDWSSDIYLTGLFNEIKSLSLELTEALIKLKGESESEEIDDIRDDQFRGIYFQVQSNLYHSDSAVKGAAESINAIIGSTGLSVVDMAYDIESSIIDSMLKKLDTPEMSAAIDLIPGLEVLIYNLNKTNSTFKESRVNFKTAKADDKEVLSATQQKKRILTLFNGKFHAYIYGMFMVDEAKYGDFTRSVMQIIQDNNLNVKKRIAAN